MKIRNKLLKYVVAVGALAGSGSAFAALPTEATAAFTSLSTTVTDVSAAVWPIVASVLVLFVTIKLVKKGANKL